MPVSGVPAKRSGLRDLKIRRRLIFTGLILAAALGLLSTVAWLTQPKPETMDIPPGIDQVWADATITAEQWLNGATLTMPVADTVDPSKVERKTFKYKELTPSGFTEQKVPQRQGESALQTLNVLFTVNLYTEAPSESNPDEIIQTPQYFTLTVPMVYDPSGKTAVLGALPSLQPVTPVSGSGIGAANYAEITLDDLANQEAVVTAIETWATTWAKSSNDPLGAIDPAFNSDLKRITGDPEPNRFYLGLGGWSVADLVIGDGTSSSLESYGGGVIFNLTMTLTSPAGGVTTSSYDVWVQDVDSASPKVVAWAATPGYTEMEPFYNGFTVG